MKKSLFSLLFLFAWVTSFAQTDKGSWLLGGTATIGTSSYSFSGSSTTTTTGITLQPTVGYFIINNLVIGAGVPLSYSSETNTSSSTIGLVPFGRYFFLEGNVKPFVQAQVGYTSTNITTNVSGRDVSYTSSGSTFGVGGGLAIFLTKSASLDLNLYYSSTTKNAPSNNAVTGTASNFGLQVGFLVYLSKGDK